MIKIKIEKKKNEMEKRTKGKRIFAPRLLAPYTPHKKKRKQHIIHFHDQDLGVTSKRRIKVATTAGGNN